MALDKFGRPITGLPVGPDLLRDPRTGRMVPREELTDARRLSIIRDLDGRPPPQQTLPDILQAAAPGPPVLPGGLGDDMLQQQLGQPPMLQQQLMQQANQNFNASVAPGSPPPAGGTALPRDLDQLSDDELLALALEQGIDTEAFGIPSIEIPQSTRDLVAREFAPMRQQTLQDITRAAVTGAGRRGLELFDTPIAEPFLRNIALASTDIGGRQAGRTLELGVGNRAFQEGARRFQEDLSQRAFANRLNLAKTFGQTGLQLNLARFGRGTGSQVTDPMSNLKSQAERVTGGGGLIAAGLVPARTSAGFFQ
jgi:hypothetical protein